MKQQVKKDPAGTRIYFYSSSNPMFRPPGTHEPLADLNQAAFHRAFSKSPGAVSPSHPAVKAKEWPFPGGSIKIGRMKKNAKPTAPLFGGPNLPTRRLENLTDGVFAIVMTLLVFNLKVPVVAQADLPGGLVHQLTGLWPQYFSFVLSVLVIGVHWVGFTAVFHLVHHSNRLHHWINILYLLCLAFVPFSAALLGQYYEQPVAVIIYCLNLIAAGGVLYLHLWYALNYGLAPDMPPPVVRMAKQRILLGVAAYLVAIPLSFISTKICLFLFVVGPLSFILPSRADQHIRPREN
jgi:uncharacterized membrane protein